MSCAIQPLDFYLLRLPRLPLSQVRELHACAEPAALVAAIRARYQTAEIQEAIYLASPELHREMMKWLTQPTRLRPDDEERLVLTLYKYLLRMSSRCTPYGLFAGFATGAITAAPTQLRLAPAPRRWNKYARLDMNYVAELSKQLTAEPSVRTKLVFTVNNSLYKIKDAYRYYEVRIHNKRRQYFLVALKVSPYIEKVLAAAGAGATYEGLLSLLEASGIAPAAARGFLDRLIDAQVLLSELEPTVTGREFYHCLVDKVASIDPQHPQLANLQGIRTLLAEPSRGVATYQAVQALIQQASPQATSKDLIQNDLRIDMADNALNQAAVGYLAEELSALAGLYQAAIPADLQQFTAAFYQRYEAQEIPLLEALDGETGVGYGPARGSKANYTPFVDDVRVPGKAAPAKVAWTAYRQLVFRKLQESREHNRPTVSLSDDDLHALGRRPSTVPSSLFAFGSLVAADAAALDAGDFRFQLTACNGPGAMPVLARFGHADPLLAEKLRACGLREQQASGDALLAEIVHLPEARVGNVLQRPQLRAYEIPFLGNASVPAENQIPVADLLVSVRDGRVVLRSRRLNKVVVPRLTTAHNYSGGLPVYKFLCDLQQQHEAFAVNWDWGVLWDQPHLPRIEYKHIILSRACWRLPASAHAEVAGSPAGEQLAAFRQQHGLPRQVVLVEGDNELLLDFSCPLAVQLLAQQLKKGPVTLYEFVHAAPSRLLTDEQGAGYVNEVVIPFLSTRPAPRPVPSVAAARPQLRRSFALGSEWTYLKVYCGTKWADKVLTDYLRPCIEELQEQGHISQWFFIRYADPNNHLRLRFRQPAGPRHLAAVLERLHQALAGLQEERIVHAIQYDTYQREIERYGAATMEFSEAVFHHDSRAVLGFLNLIEGEAGERYRWLFAVRGADQLLTDFGLTLAEKAAVAEQAREGFFQEFRGNAELTHQLNDKYRAVSRQLSRFLDPAHDSEEIADAVALFDERSAAIRADYQELEATLDAAADPTAGLRTQVRHLLPSYLHMFLNRIFIANQRLHELVVYHYLAKHYTSVAAREKQLAYALR